MENLIASHLATQLAQVSVELAASKASLDVANGQLAYINQVLDAEPKLRKLFEETEAKLVAESEVIQ